MSHILNGHKTSRSHLFARVLKVYAEASTRFSHVVNPDGLINTCSLKAVSLKQLLVWQQWTEHTLQGQGRRWETSVCLDPAWGSACSHILLMTSSKTSKIAEIPSYLNFLCLCLLLWFYRLLGSEFHSPKLTLVDLKQTAKQFSIK